MKDKKMTDEEFVRKYEAHEKETTDNFIRRHSSTEIELRETIEYLIHHRQLMRDVELESLEAEVHKLIQKIRETKSKMLLEEIECFKDILSLQKRILQENDQSRN